MLTSRDHGLVTVGIPTYNRPEGLRQTLGCITSQTYRDLQIIVSDNCSEDPQSQRVAEEFARVDTRVRYHRQPQNLGAVNNFLYLLNSAKGEYFMWAADDDFWEVDFVERLLDLLGPSRRAVMAFCSIGTLEQRGSVAPAFDYRGLRLSSDRTYHRVLDFVRLKEETVGKASLIYGLYRTSALRSEDVARVLLSCPWAGDNAAILAVLLAGPFLLSEETSYYFAQHNTKHYELPGRVRAATAPAWISSSLKLAKHRGRYFAVCRALVARSAAMHALERIGVTTLLIRRQVWFLAHDAARMVSGLFKLVKARLKRMIFGA